MHIDEVRLAKFINGDVNEEEFEFILNHLEECKDCRKKYQELLALKAISWKDKEDIKFIKWKRFYLIAASVVIFLTVTLFLSSIILKNKWGNNFLLYIEKNYYPYEKSGVRGEDDDNFRDIMNFYAEGKFDIFASKMERYLKKNFDVRGAFYLGVVYYVRGEYDCAEKYLKLATENYSVKFYPERFWYLANTYIKEKKFKEAVSILKDLSSFENPYRERAQRLLKSVE